MEITTSAFGKSAIAVAALAACGIIVVLAEADAAEPQKFAALDRAARDMKAATEPGVSYERFRELAAILAVELLSAKEKIDGEEDRELVLLFARAGLAYGDGLTLWRKKLERKSSQLPSKLPDMTPVVSRYRIHVVGAPGDEHVDADGAIRLIWAAGNEALAKAESLYHGRDRERAVVEAKSRAEAERIAAEQARAASEAAHQRALAEEVAEEFDRAEREAQRPKPYEAAVGNWACPRGYVIRNGRCLSDEDIARLPKVEIR